MVIAATAGTAVVQSATKEDGLVNQAFKITVLIGLALAVGVGIFLLYNLTNILDGLFTIRDTVGLALEGIGMLGNPIFAVFSWTAATFFGRK